MFALFVIVAGVSGTLLMSSVMWFIHRRGWANADMIRAVGSLVTRRYENSLGPGLLMHLAAGCLFAVPYLFIIRSVGVTNVFSLLLIGATLGTFHGAAMIFILMALAEKHPLPQFRKAEIDVAWAHVVGHVAYGTGIGLVTALVGARLGVVTQTMAGKVP
jgi:hypothetical protein